jgi:sec-independent protein translocase protein TatA
MFDIGMPELVIIVIAFALLFFGSKKISDFARGLGRVSGEFKKGKKDIEREIKNSEDEVTNSVKTTTVETKPVETRPADQKVS